MLQSRTLHEQIESAGSDPVRTLIVGAGVAGASLAALLRRRGRHPVLIERAEAGASAGYMLGLLPLAGNLLHALDRYPQYLEASCSVGAYEFGDGRGRIVRHFGFGDFFAANGDYRGIDRGSLIDVVSGDGVVSRGTLVVAIKQGVDAASVTFSDGTIAEFDLVVVADGLHSATRSLVQPQRELGSYDSKWGGWVVWAPLGEQAPTAYSE
jgi:salicylate hydroxylase